MTPGQLAARVEEALGVAAQVESAVSGGSIHRAYRVRAGTDRVFVKAGEGLPESMFTAEARGLDRLRACAAVRVPEVLHVDASMLVLEWIAFERPRHDAGAILGRAIADLHRVSAPSFGLDHDNWIGRLPQANTPHADWHRFYVASRLRPQLERGVRDGTLPRDVGARVEAVCDRWAEIVPAPAAPALLHGDLWGGNHGFDAAGRPVLYDPAVYFGHPESELGFTTLFGGFEPGFHAAWEAASGAGAEWRTREAAHHLYPLLVHANLFGGAYVAAVDRAARRYA